MDSNKTRFLSYFKLITSKLLYKRVYPFNFLQFISSTATFVPHVSCPTALLPYSTNILNNII